MWTVKRLLPAALLLFLLAPGALQGQRGGAAGSDEAGFLRAVAEHFSTPQREILVLSRWNLSAGEIPVVLFVAERAGVSPDVVVAQRRRGGSWMEIAGELSVHAGDFHVRIDGDPGVLAGAFERFNAREASQWREVPLSDEEVVGLVNVRFLARFLSVTPARVVKELGGGGDMVGVFTRLRGGGGR